MTKFGKLFWIGWWGCIIANSVSFILLTEQNHRIIGVVAGALWFLFIGLMAPLSMEAKQ